MEFIEVVGALAALGAVGYVIYRWVRPTVKDDHKL